MSASQNAAELGPLPQWDLSDLYPGRDSAELKAALADSETGAKQFRSRYEGKLAVALGRRSRRRDRGLRAACKRRSAGS